jgi:hypothetical protein
MSLLLSETHTLFHANIYLTMFRMLLVRYGMATDMVFV